MGIIGRYKTARSTYTCTQMPDGSFQVEKFGRESTRALVSPSCIPQVVKTRCNGNLAKSIQSIFANASEYKPSFKGGMLSFTPTRSARLLTALKNNVIEDVPIMGSTQNQEKSAPQVLVARARLELVKDTKRAIDYLKKASSCSNDPAVYLEYLQTLHENSHFSLKSAVCRFIFDCLTFKEDGYIIAAYQAAEYLTGEEKDSAKALISMVVVKQNPCKATYARLIASLPEELKTPFREKADSCLATVNPNEAIAANAFKNIDSESAAALADALGFKPPHNRAQIMNAMKEMIYDSKPRDES